MRTQSFIISLAGLANFAQTATRHWRTNEQCTGASCSSQLAAAYLLTAESWLFVAAARFSPPTTLSGRLRAFLSAAEFPPTTFEFELKSLGRGQREFFSNFKPPPKRPSDRWTLGLTGGLIDRCVGGRSDTSGSQPASWRGMMTQSD